MRRRGLRRLDGQGAQRRRELLGLLLRQAALGLRRERRRAEPEEEVAPLVEPVAQFLERWRSLLSRRSRLDFDQETTGFSRIEVAVAFLALLELRKAGEVALSQAVPFAPIRISRAASERSLSWTAHSA